MFKPTMFLLLFAINSESTAACSSEEALRTVSGFYSAVAYFSGIPSLQEIEKISPFISSNLSDQLEEASLLDEANSKKAQEAGESFWGSETKIFLSAEDGFSDFKILPVAIDPNEVPVQLTIALPNDTPFHWIDKAVVITELGHCVVSDVILEGGLKATEKLKRIVDEMK